MIVPSDEDYQQTKLIKSGKQQLLLPFKELADWFTHSFPGVTLLNIHYDRIQPGNRPRLSVILEWERDLPRFRKQGNFDPILQTKVASKFRSILTDLQDTAFSADRLLVIFCAFESIARIEANWSITKEHIANLKGELSSQAIWDVRPMWGTVAFFFHTEAQLKASEASGLRNLCTDAYSKMLSQYDEFGYFRERPIDASFDSKENFDANYGGNWFNYDR
jgi:hypothetical protein